MAIYLSMQRARFSSAAGYEKFKNIFADVRHHLKTMPGFLHLTFWVHPEDPGWYNEITPPITAPTWTTSFAGPSRSSRAINESCKVTGISRPVSFALPLSSTARVISSTKSGTPLVRSTTVAIVSSDNAFCAATSPTIVRTLRELSRLSAICV
jgi:hypothetical protein